MAIKFALMHSLNASVFNISRNVLLEHTQKMQVTTRDLALTEEMIRVGLRTRSAARSGHAADPSLTDFDDFAKRTGEAFARMSPV